MKKYNPWSGLMFFLRKMGASFLFVQQYWYVSGLEGQEFPKRLPKMAAMCFSYIYRRLIGKTDIVRITQIITTRCNLKCKYCSELMPFYEKANIAADDHVDSIFMYMHKIISLSDRVEVFNLLGGEPFIYKDLGVLLERLTELDEMKRVRYIVITTNGTVLPNMSTLSSMKKFNEFYKKKKGTKLVVWISNYGKISRNFNNLINLMRENNIICLPETEKPWLPCNFDIRDRQLSSSELRDHYKRCIWKNCHVLCGGIIYHCFLEKAHVDLKFSPDYKDSVIELREIATQSDFKKHYKRFIRCKSMRACNFCEDRSMSADFVVSAGEQLKSLNELKLKANED